MSRSRAVAVAAFGILISILASACSGGQTGDGPAPADIAASPAAASTAVPGTAGQEPTGRSASTDPGTGDGPEQAILTIGERTYVFGPSELGPLCTPQEDGSIKVTGYTSGFKFPTTGASLDGRIQTDGFVDADLDNQGSDDAYLWIHDADNGLVWNANAGHSSPRVNGSNSRVDDSTLQGGHAEGSALFIEEGQVDPAGTTSLDPTSGQFDITCG